LTQFVLDEFGQVIEQFIDVRRRPARFTLSDVVAEMGNDVGRAPSLSGNLLHYLGQTLGICRLVLQLQIDCRCVVCDCVQWLSQFMSEPDDDFCHRRKPSQVGQLLLPLLQLLLSSFLLRDVARKMHGSLDTSIRSKQR